ncbi:MAG: class I SAM-dependent methyltransferase [Terriglobales bacterium]
MDIKENLRYWDEYDWPSAGDEWSAAWGSSQEQWNTQIFPHISRFVPTHTILEIAPGYGRWTQFLYPLCTRLILVDLVSKCIDACRRRFACVDHIEYHVNDGRSLDAIENNSVDFVFSMDSLVHADPTVMREYTLQLGRKLRDGGLGFIHHSNLGAYHHWLLAKSLIVKCCRGNSWLGNLLIHDCLSDRNMTAAQMRRFLEESKLECVSQETFPWGSSRRPIDAFTVFRNK